MARPFNTFEKEIQSPLTPNSAGSSSNNTPISYKTDINRKKTSKWANAKPVSYDDGWGDDDYGYADPAPPPSKPTGLRQQGQAALNPESPVGISTTKKNYGDLPALPISGAQRPRANSFDTDDEKRNFSSGTAAQQSQPPVISPPAAATPTRLTPSTGLPSNRDVSGLPALSVQTQLPSHSAVTGLRKPSSQVSPATGFPQSDLRPAERTNSESSSVVSTLSDTRTASIDYQARPDYSPSAAPPPLHTRASPAPQSTADSPSSRFPPRKTSLSQSVSPDVAEIMGTLQESTPKPWVGGRPASPSGPRSPATTPGKALPFIRPADIYKRRMEEERERKSMESSRTSMDSNPGARASDISESPAVKPLEKSSSSENLGSYSRRGPGIEVEESDSGRIRPTLEPVKERKSEYGFDGFNVNEPSQSTMPEITRERNLSDVDTHEQKLQSISPKLPNLNRISGFGMDLFSPSKIQNSQETIMEDNESTPTASSNTNPSTVEPPLRNEPSLGLTTAVNDAFDRKSDSSLPATPCTNSESKRTGSDSGSAEISPIMSRGSSAAAPESHNVDALIPPMPEAVVSHDVPSGLAAQNIDNRYLNESSEPTPRAFTPGHRRPVSTASIGNATLVPSPVLVKPSQLAALSDPSPATAIDEHEILQPPRPITEREQSFRPLLPGGWTSYATTERSASPHIDDSTESRVSIDHTETPPTRTWQGEIDRDTIPTTTNFPEPRSTLDKAALGGAIASRIAVTNDNVSPIGTPRTGTPTREKGERITPAAHIMTPSILTQGTRPGIINRDISTGPNQAPTPPAKDTPTTVADDPSDYFPKPTTPLKEITSEHVLNHVIVQSQALPATNDESEPEDHESDLLQKEIIKSLSPKPSNTMPQDNSLLSVSSDNAEDQSSSNPARISSYLPSEYDNYWASTAEEEHPTPVVTAPARNIENPFNSEIITPQVPRSAVAEPTIYPLSAQKRESERSLGATRPSVPQRFSWEASSEDVSALPIRTEAPPVPKIESHPIEKIAEPERKLEPEPVETQFLSTTGHEGLRSNPHSRSTSSDSHTRRDAALLAGATADLGTAAAVGYASNQTQMQHERRLSLAEEKDQTSPRVSSYPVSPTPPEDEHPSRAEQPYFSTLVDEPHNPTVPSAPPSLSLPPVPSQPASSLSPINSPQQFSPATRILAFKEIAAMKSPHQRIQTFDETRQRFATMDSGLINWMADLRSRYPEHAEVTSSLARSGVAGFASRPRTGKGVAPPLQQPYYQQYLNASSPAAPGTPVGRPGPSTPAGSQQSFAPSSGRINSQQVQAKGKELLHTAGVFGGKAGKAGKSLLAKGKTKLQQARGAGDKIPESPSPKPKNERRTSWGFPLTLSKSSGRNDSTSRTSRDSTPNPMPLRERAATLTLDTRPTPVISPMTGATTDNDYGIMSAPEILDNMSGALPITEAPASHQIQQHVRQYQIPGQAPRLAEPESGGDLRVPAPIGKNQPSWDPFNATPIAEEDGFQLDEHPRHQTRSMQPSTHDSTMPVLTEATSPHSNSDLPFGQTQEGPADLRDWVMVPKVQESKTPVSVSPETLSPPATNSPCLSTGEMANPGVTSKDIRNDETKSLSVMNRPRGESYTSALDRPRYSYNVPQPFQEEQGLSSAPLSQPSKNLQPEYRHDDSQQLSSSSPRNESANNRPPTTTPEIQSQNVISGYSIQPNDVQPRYQAPSGPPPGRSAQPKNIQPNSRLSPVNTAVQPAQPQHGEPQSTTSFKGLPPIRRTSTFGAGFSSRHARKRFGSDDDNESTPSGPAESNDYGQPQNMTAVNAVAAAAIINPEAHRRSQENLPQTQVNQPDPNRPPMSHRESTDYSQNKPALQGQSPMYNAPRTADYLVRKSQDSWRPNAAQAQSPVASSPTKWSEATVSPPRPSIDQRSKRMSGQSFTNERAARPSSTQPPARSYETPPSAAQRYPGLFRPEQPDFEGVGDGGDLPPHHYQAPIAREEAFLPRTQANEYSLLGVGPPVEEPRPASRRNSGVWSDIGSKIRRASRERSGSITRETALQTPRYEAQGNEYAQSSIASEEVRDQKRLRAGFFGFSRASTTGLGPPQSRESMIAHHPGSRTDLLPPGQSPTVANERKKSFFGSSDHKLKSSKVGRTSTSGALVAEEPGKKKRFSGISSVFGRSKDGPPGSRGSVDRPQTTRELSYHERQPLESPAPQQQQFPREPPPLQNPIGTTQPKGFLNKIVSGGESLKPKNNGKARKSSTAGLLGGIMGRRSNQQDKSDSSSQGTRSQGSGPKSTRPNVVPPARTYTDLQEHATPLAQQAPPAPWREPTRAPNGVQPQKRELDERDRGRRSNRGAEPQYANVPIPGGYSLVRAEGATPVQTDYDPRGLNRAQQPIYQYVQPAGRHNSLPGGPQRFMDQAPTPSPPPPQGPADRRMSQQRPGPGEPVESSETTERSDRRVSREDILARSPARAPSSQQRPYQLSLPEDSEDRDTPIISPPASIRAPSSIQITPSKPVQHGSIQRLTQPTPYLRHPESPAGYPLPDDTVFSPINPSASNLPPPPPPKWPAHLDNHDHHHLHIDLDRSNTRRTAVSALSGMSSPPEPEPRTMLAPMDNSREGFTPSPTPPSPGITPPPPEQRRVSVAPTPQEERRRSHIPMSSYNTSTSHTPSHPGFSNSNILTTHINLRGHSPDLYSASPRLPKDERKVQEEKIYYNPNRSGADSEEADEGPAVMSATSFPGQEWNPYAGVYEEYD